MIIGAFYYPFNTMQYGIVKFFHNTKKFGFITTDNGEDIFFHVTGIVAGDEDEFGRKRAKFIPREGDRVQFKTVSTDKGPKAVDVDKTDIDTRERSSEDDE